MVVDPSPYCTVVRGTENWAYPLLFVPLSPRGRHSDGEADGWSTLTVTGESDWDDSPAVVSGNCRNCGAPVVRTGVCEYCGS